MDQIRRVLAHEAGHYAHGVFVERIKTTAIGLRVREVEDKFMLHGSTFKVGPESAYESFWSNPEDRECFERLWMALCGMMAGYAAEMMLLGEEIRADGANDTDTDAYVEESRKEDALLEDASGSDLFRTELYAAPLARFLLSERGRSLEWTQKYREKIEGRDSLAAVFLEEGWDELECYMGEVSYLADALAEKYIAAMKNPSGYAGGFAVVMAEDEIKAAIEAGERSFREMCESIK